MPQKKALWFTATYGDKPPAKIRKRIPRMSKKRQRDSRLYNKNAKAFLDRHRNCQVERCIRRSTQVHHTAGRRGTNYLDETTWMAVCLPCHDEIHRHPKWAMAKGYLKSFHT